MKIDLEFVELHTPLFIDGMNFGLKLYSDYKKSKAPIQIWYDTDLKHTIVIHKNKVAMIENTASMTLKDPNQINVAVAPIVTSVSNKAIETTVNVAAQVSGPGIGLKHSAQVSTPITNAPKTILRRAKYQGQESQGE